MSAAHSHMVRPERGRAKLQCSPRLGSFKGTFLGTSNREPQEYSGNIIGIRVVVKIMVPFWIPTVIRHLIFKYLKWDNNFDNHPYTYQGPYITYRTL